VPQYAKHARTAKHVPQCMLSTALWFCLLALTPMPFAKCHVCYKSKMGERTKEGGRAAGDKSGLNVVHD
jgi:hypothetical protein